MPNSAASGRPRVPDSGRETIGASMPMPMNTASAPIPTRAIAGSLTPASTAIRPQIATIPPSVTRRRSESPSSSRWSTSAATGGIRTARRAGPIADSNVTPTPTPTATAAVRALKTSGAEGSVMPNAFSSATSPSAARIPRPRPISEATRPVRAASPSTERNSCRRLAPTMRNSASSRVRCPTVIENVLKIVNAPTNSEMNANTSSAVEMNDRSLLMRFVSSPTTV